MGNTRLTNIGALLAGGAAMLSGFTPTAPNSPISPPMPLLTATVLNMGGTMSQLSVPQDSPEFIWSYIDDMYRTYIAPSGLCTGGDPGCTRVGVYTPEQFGLVTGWRDMTFDASVKAGLANLDKCLRGMACAVTDAPYTATQAHPLPDRSFTVVGYSQSATIASREKAFLIDRTPDAAVNFVLVANPNRPNGGILSRFTGLHIPGVTFDAATPTGSSTSAPLTTVDVARQYDLISDFPTNPLNLLADINAVIGYFTVHGKPFSGGTPELQGQHQDSTYYLIPTPILPLLAPVNSLPVIGHLLAAVFDPALRVLVEAGYDRAANPGTPQRANLGYFPKPITTLRNLLAAVPAGWDNGIAHFTGNPENRPFRTAVPPVYGVGGPPVNSGAVDPYAAPTRLAPSAVPAAPRVAAQSSTQSAGRAGAGPRSLPRARSAAPAPAVSAGPPDRPAHPRGR